MKAVKNMVNIPDYIRAHFKIWSLYMESGSTIVKIKLGTDTESTKLVDKANTMDSVTPETVTTPTTVISSDISTNNFISGINSLEDYTNFFISKIVSILNPFLAPVLVDYSNQVLADQLYHISILLFLLSIFLTILIVYFMFTTLIFVYSDRISTYFTNKYILRYINYTRKLIGLELILLGSAILYIMSNLIYGIHFLATHPIT